MLEVNMMCVVINDGVNDGKTVKLLEWVPVGGAFIDFDGLETNNANEFGCWLVEGDSLETTYVDDFGIDTSTVYEPTALMHPSQLIPLWSKGIETMFCKDKGVLV
jgi:hypothetical protein